MKPDQTLANLIGVKYKYYCPVDDEYRDSCQCGLRSLTKVSSETYKKVYKRLTKEAVKKYGYMNDIKIITKVANKHYGFKPMLINSDISVATFCGYYKEGEYLIFITGHVFPYINGCIYDCVNVDEAFSQSDLEGLLMNTVQGVLVKRKKKNKKNKEKK